MNWKFWRRKSVVTVMEQTKQKHNEHLVALDRKRQAPLAQLADVNARSQTLRAELHAAQLRLSGAATVETRAAIKREIQTLESGIADLQREADGLLSKIKRFDDEMATHHAQIRAIEFPEDVAELRRRRDLVWQTLDAARIALAEYCLEDRRFKVKYAHNQESMQKSGIIREELHTREAGLHAEGWTDVDATWATVGPRQVVPMLPPVKRP
jgi:chromosome segregation ATPase